MKKITLRDLTDDLIMKYWLMFSKSLTTLCLYGKIPFSEVLNYHKVYKYFSQVSVRTKHRNTAYLQPQKHREHGHNCKRLNVDGGYIGVRRSVFQLPGISKSVHRC
jgi:hypothetical protein